MYTTYIILTVIALIYVWRIFKGSHNGLVGEVGSLADIVIISLAVVAGIVLVESILGKKLIGFLVSGIILLIALLARGLLRVVFGSLGLIAKLPLISGCNKFLGAFAGVAEGTAIAWVGFALISLLNIPVNGEPLVRLVTANRFLNFLYQNNMLYRFIQRMIGMF